MASASGDDRPRVLVTGATGFIASHIVQQLLESGQYTVRGTVRDLTQKNKIAHLKAMVNAPPDPEPEPEPIKDEKIEDKKDEEKKEEEKKEEEKEEKEKKDEEEEKKEEKIEDAAEEKKEEKKEEPAADATTEEGKKEETAEAKTEEKTEEAPAETGEEKKEGEDVKADETKTEGDGKTDDEKVAEKKEEEQKETKAEVTGPTTWEYGDLQLHKADLLDADCWRGLIEGCTYVIHTASPFPLTNPRNEDDVIKPAVEGTTNVLKAVAANGEIKRVILTSSLAAICAAPEANKVYTEEDWTNTDRAQAYLKSKALAEKAAWDYMKDLKEGEKFELVVLNPGYVMGPVISKNSFTSMEAVVRLLQRSMPAVPKINLNIIDVRDVAKAHIIALTNEQAADNRHILVQGNMWLREVAQILAKEFKPQGYNVPTMSCPKFLLRISSWFDGGLRMVVPYVGKVLTCDNKRMKEVLAMEERPLSETILDMAYSLVDGGFVKKTSKYKGHPKDRPEEPKEEKKADAAVKENGEVAITTPAVDSDAKPDATEDPKADGEVKVNGEVPTQDGDAPTKEAAEEEAKEDVTEEKKVDGDVKENGEVQGKEEAPAAEDAPKEETAEAKEEKPEEEAAKPESTSQPEAEAAAPSAEASEPTEEKKEEEGSAAAAAPEEPEKKE